MNRFLTAHMQVCLCNCEKCLSFLWLLEVKPASITICFLSLFCIFVFFTPLSDSRGEISHLWSLSQLNISLMRVSIWSDRLVMKGLCLCEWKLGVCLGGWRRSRKETKTKFRNRQKTTFVFWIFFQHGWFKHDLKLCSAEQYLSHHSIVLTLASLNCLSVAFKHQNRLQQNVCVFCELSNTHT